MVGNSGTSTISFNSPTSNWTWSATTVWSCEISDVEKAERRAAKEKEKADIKKLEHQKKVKELQKLDRKFLHSRKI